MKGILTILAALSFVMAGCNAGSPTAGQLLSSYYVIQKSLASDSISGVSAAASTLEQISQRAAVMEPKNKTVLAGISAAAAKLEKADLQSARNVFGELGDGMIAYLKSAGINGNPPYQFYCPMVRKNWLQPDKDIRNPYYGSEMLTCGRLVKS